MLGIGTFSALASLTSVVIPKENLWWLPAASLSKVDFDSLSSGFRYATTTYSSMDLKSLILIESKVEIVGRVERRTYWMIL